MGRQAFRRAHGEPLIWNIQGAVGAQGRAVSSRHGDRGMDAGAEDAILGPEVRG